MGKRFWNSFQRENQSKLIHTWKPWLRSSGPTHEGMKTSRYNALKHGICSESMLNLRKNVHINQEMKQYEQSAKKYLTALKKGEYDDLSEYDDVFCNSFKQVRLHCENKSDSRSQWYRLMYIFAIYQRVVSALSKALSRNTETLKGNLLT
jgi:hypothetical protein